MKNLFVNCNHKLLAWVNVIVCLLMIIVFIVSAHTAQIRISNTHIVEEGNYYALTAIIVEVDIDNDLVTVEDSTGNRWQFYGVEDWEVNDCASLLMWDNGTEYVTDDEIHSARYNAWGLTQ